MFSVKSSTDALKGGDDGGLYRGGLEEDGDCKSGFGSVLGDEESLLVALKQRGPTSAKEVEAQ